jgi:23S rRNA G2445 N2-methylase RlmL
LQERQAFASETVIQILSLILFYLEFDPLKCEYARHNGSIYNVDKNIQVINKDFLQLTMDDIKFPPGRHSEMDVVYASPPWGGIGYNLLPEYSLTFLYPDFKKVLKKALEFSRNLILFLPKNTSVDELIDYLIDFSAEFSNDPENRKNELVLEIEQIVYGTSCKGIHIYTGKMASIE